jgi:hypothetical protein
MDVLVILLGESGKLLDGRKVWALPNPIEHLCHAWLRCGKLDMGRRNRARDKILRFLATACVIPVKCTKLIIPTRRPGILRAVRQCVRRCVLAAFPQHGPYTRRFLEHRFKYFHGKDKGLLDRFADHHQVAATVDYALLDDYTAEEVDSYVRRTDVRWTNYNLRCPGSYYSPVVVAAVVKQIKRWNAGNAASPLDDATV